MTGNNARDEIERLKLKTLSDDVGFESIEDGLVTQWYKVSKIMATNITHDYPYFTFQGIVEEIMKDPSFKHGD